eukprot:3077327-Rhodomonas_salina.1
MSPPLLRVPLCDASALLQLPSSLFRLTPLDTSAPRNPTVYQSVAPATPPPAPPLISTLSETSAPLKPPVTHVSLSPPPLLM